MQHLTLFHNYANLSLNPRRGNEARGLVAVSVSVVWNNYGIGTERDNDGFKIIR